MSNILAKVEKEIPERTIWVDDAIQPIKFLRFRDFSRDAFYGGYLVYQLNGRLYRTYVSDRAAEKIMAVKES
jgi:hypothetical protein